ncbi:MAG: hypothetical protein RI985_1921, partial [Chloroflexota bacterium]
TKLATIIAGLARDGLIHLDGTTINLPT